MGQREASDAPPQPQEDETFRVMAARPGDIPLPHLIEYAATSLNFSAPPLCETASSVHLLHSSDHQFSVHCTLPCRLLALPSLVSVPPSMSFRDRPMPLYPLPQSFLAFARLPRPEKASKSPRHLRRRDFGTTQTKRLQRKSRWGNSLLPLRHLLRRLVRTPPDLDVKGSTPPCSTAWKWQELPNIAVDNPVASDPRSDHVALKVA